MLDHNAGKKELARKMRSDGYSVPEIARAVEMSEATARLWVRDIAPGERTRRLGTYAASAERQRFFGPLRKRAKEMRALGMSCKEVAAIVGVSDKTVSDWTKKPRSAVKPLPQHLRTWNDKMRKAGIRAVERQRLIDEAIRSERTA